MLGHGISISINLDTDGKHEDIFNLVQIYTIVTSQIYDIRYSLFVQMMGNFKQLQSSPRNLFYLVVFHVVDPLAYLSLELNTPLLCSESDGPLPNDRDIQI